MKIIPTAIPDVLIIEPQVFGDARGWFLESWQRERYAAAGIPAGLSTSSRSPGTTRPSASTGP